MSKTAVVNRRALRVLDLRLTGPALLSFKLFYATPPTTALSLSLSMNASAVMLASTPSLAPP